MDQLDPNDRLAELFSAMCDGELDDVGIAELEVALEDPEVQIAYLKYCQMHAELRLKAHSLRGVETFRQRLASKISEISEASETANVAEDPDKQKQDVPPSHANRAILPPILTPLSRYPVATSFFVASLIIGIVITSLAFFAPPLPRGHVVRRGSGPNDDLQMKVAQITQVRQAKWSNNFLDAQSGGYMHSGATIELDSGLVEVTYLDGTKVVLEGPCGYRIGKSTGFLLSGKVSAKVPPQAIGFTVATATIDVVDLGTEFGVEIKETNVVAGKPAVAVQVFQGRVALVKADGSTLQELATGDSALVTPDLEVAKAPQDSEFVRDIPDPGELAGVRADFESELDPRVRFDIPDPSLAEIHVRGGELVLATHGDTNMWVNRENAPFAWSEAPEVAPGEKWFVETHVRFLSGFAVNRDAGIVFHSEAGKGGSQDGADFSYALNDWNQLGVACSGLGGREFGDSGRTKVSAVSQIGNVQSAFLRIEITELGESDHYKLMYKVAANDPWSTLTEFKSSQFNQRPALFLKTLNGTPETRQAAFSYFHVDRLPGGSR